MPHPNPSRDPNSQRQYQNQSHETDSSATDTQPHDHDTSKCEHGLRAISCPLGHDAPSVRKSVEHPSTRTAYDAAMPRGGDVDGSIPHLRGGGGFNMPQENKKSPGGGRNVRSDKDAPRSQQPATARREEKKKGKEVSIAPGSPKVIDSQSIVNQYRERLARDMERRDSTGRGPEKVRVSPIREEALSLSPTPDSGSDVPTASTESNKTVRGGITPSFLSGATNARTPSYPFPRMAMPSHSPSTVQRSFSNLSQSGILKSTGGQFDNPVSFDQVRSDPSTPTSALTFQPAGAIDLVDNFGFPAPNLYELSLMLSAEPGLDAWWNAVVQIMREHYKAERVTLSVPADSTDLENVPWGQKATYSAMDEEELSMAYMGRGSSMIQSSFGDQSEQASNVEGSQRGDRFVRPSIQSRHSFTSYENRKETSKSQVAEGSVSALKRPSAVARSKSYFPATDYRPQPSHHPALNQQALAEHDAVEKEQQQPVPTWEAPTDHRREVKGRVLPVLQGLDFEADPLLDHNGVNRVIERGKVIALTRNYPYLDPAAESKSSNFKAAATEESKKKPKKPIRNDSATKLSSLLSNVADPRASSRNRKTMGDRTKMASLMSVLDDDGPRAATPKFEEYEQTPPSPWSQSPAPSPAIRAEPNENPFFTDAMVDESSFEPGPSPHDYSNIQAPETIGVDNSWTVLHIPLKHILLSKSPQAFKLNSAALGQKTNLRGRTGSYVDPTAPEPSFLSQSPPKPRQSPIAILSILTPVIPYPSNLRYSLEHLAPHLATSFSLCRHYSNLETEVSGLHRKRPSTAGFGALGPDGRSLVDPILFAQLNYAPSEDPSQRSVAGSITSPSDYSVPSRSAAGSPGGTPNWDPGSFGLVVERRPTGTSPGNMGGDSYFSTEPRSGEVMASTPDPRLSRSTQDAAPAEERHRRLSSGGKSIRPDIKPTGGLEAPEAAVGGSASASDDSVSSAAAQRRGTLKETPAPISRKHTMLHSYGGDFATTFQSLPLGTELRTKPTALPQSGPATTTQVSMLPPSDRLKGLMLDSLPAHVFVALPMTGEIVWVNSRYLSYRGQTVADLVMDPWGSLHPEDRESYLENWTKSLHTGEPFAHSVRLRRFDGAYRWHQARAVASKDKRGVIVQFIGSYMDIHDQKVAEVMAARQEEIEASEAKHRLLANLIPQIIFTATEDEGITFANQQWLSYTGQHFEDSLGVGFMDYVHPDDLARCRIPTERSSSKNTSPLSPVGLRTSATATPTKPPTAEQTTTSKETPQALSRNNSSGSSSLGDIPTADLSELAKQGILKVATDSAGRLSYTTELRLRSKTGEYRWHLIRCVEIDNIDFGNGESSYFGSATDINDHKLLEEKLKEAMESKSRFLSNMSHEIRTPLIGISGMVSFLQDTILNEEQRDYTNTIQTSANSLLMIINDILDLSKVDAGMMKLNFEWFHTRSLIEDVNELVSTMAIAKKLELNYVVEEDVPSWVKGDKVRIRQVLLNVIGNAIKFTPQGEVFSRCKVSTAWDKELHENEIQLEFSIIDTGRGFTKEEAELIFKPFSQIDGSSTRQHGGSGLGLVISRQLVELHGGMMDGTAVPGEGSTFTFTARFGLPTEADHPNATGTPPMELGQTPSEASSASTIKPLLVQKAIEIPFTNSPGSDASALSPAVGSSASSDPSVRSARTFNTSRSSVSSVAVGLVHFSEAAKASGQELSQIKLEMPTGVPSPKLTPAQENSKFAEQLDQFRPPMYSILIICPQTYSREATTKHIEMTLPKDVPHQITAVASVAEAQNLIGGQESVTFTHIVLNLGSAEEILGVIDQIVSAAGGKTSVLVLSDSVQRQAVLKLVTDSQHQQLLSEHKIAFIYKPVKPSRFAAVFDPAKSRDLSIDRNRSTAAQMVESQKQSYLDIEKRIGNKGYRVLLVEDNPVNQKVLVRYLKKVGVNADIAADGVECTEAIFSHPHGFYSLVLCDLHMPRKDGYQACREIRQWEKKNKHPKLPIIALSANVMSDVQDKCIEAGFSDYVTKPVDFIDLSTAMSKFF